MKRSTLILILVVFIGILSLIIDARFIEPYRLTVESIEISSPKLSRSTGDITIVQLSDLHLTAIGDFERKVISQVNDLQPDLIVITGDLFSRSTIFEKSLSREFRQELEHIASFVSSLRAKHGLYLIRGNNDFGNDKETSDRFLEKMATIQTPVLANMKSYLEIEGTKLCLLGVDYSQFDKSKVADFGVDESSGNRFLQSGYSRRNSYSHFFAIDNPSRWRNYTYTGRMRLTDPQTGSIGVTFYSQFYLGYDKFYRLRETASEPTLRFSPHGTNVTGGHRDTGVIPRANTWYQFRIHVHSADNQTEMRAKVWSEHSPEPEQWQAHSFDDSTRHLSDGTVGVWSSGGGQHHFDDLMVVSDDGDTLLQEDFAGTPAGRNPLNWVAYNYNHEAVPMLMRSVPDSCFTVLLAHTPDFMKWEKMTGIDLVLSGHTHGGQIRLPILGSPVVRIDLGRKYMQGLHRIDKTWLYVNRGIGTILLPMRFLCPPEITVINLKAEKRAGREDDK